MSPNDVGPVRRLSGLEGRLAITWELVDAVAEDARERDERIESDLRRLAEQVEGVGAGLTQLRAEVETLAALDRDRPNLLGAEVRRLREQVDGLVAELETFEGRRS